MELYRKIYIKNDNDLPKQDTRTVYFVHHKKANNYETCPYFNDSLKEYWLDNFDWYLQPIEITDADIEAWANGLANPESKKSFERGEWIGIKEGANAILNGDIKHKL